jgi:hypothetical protein
MLHLSCAELRISTLRSENFLQGSCFMQFSNKPRSYPAASAAIFQHTEDVHEDTDMLQTMQQS